MGRYKISAAITLAALVATLIDWAAGGRNPYGWVFPAVFLLGEIAWLIQLSRAGPPATGRMRRWRLTIISLLMLPGAAGMAMLLWAGWLWALNGMPYDDTWGIAVGLALPFLVVAPFAWMACRAAFARADKAAERAHHTG